MYTRELARRLNAELERLTGCKIGEQYISTDKYNFSTNYIPVESLQRGRPIIIVHYIGVRMVFIPHEDWNSLCKRKVTVEEYVSTSIWNYGYYWGSNRLETGGIYWQPLEGGEPGINDREKIKRYFTMLKCRAYEEHRKESPMMIWCSDCYLEKCPMSVVKRKKENVTEEEEIQERNVRQEVFEAYKKMLKERFDLDACSLGIKKEFNGATQTIYVLQGYHRGMVKLFISEEMFIDMMYRPEKYDIDKMLKRYKLVACIETYNQSVRDFVTVRAMTVTSQMERADLDKFWGCE